MKNNPLKSFFIFTIIFTSFYLKSAGIVMPQLFTDASNFDIAYYLKKFDIDLPLNYENSKLIFDYLNFQSANNITLLNKDLKPICNSHLLLKLFSGKIYVENMTPLLIAISTPTYDDDLKLLRREKELKDDEIFNILIFHQGRKGQFIKYLLSQKPNVNAQDSLGNTALHYAILLASLEEEYHIQLKIIRKLLKHPNIKLEIPNNFGETPMDIAKKYNLKEIGQMLIKPIAKERSESRKLSIESLKAIVAFRMKLYLPQHHRDYIYHIAGVIEDERDEIYSQIA